MFCDHFSKTDSIYNQYASSLNCSDLNAGSYLLQPLLPSGYCGFISINSLSTVHNVWFNQTLLMKNTLDTGVVLVAVWLLFSNLTNDACYMASKATPFARLMRSQAHFPPEAQFKPPYYSVLCLCHMAELKHFLNSLISLQAGRKVVQFRIIKDWLYLPLWELWTPTEEFIDSREVFSPTRELQETWEHLIF